MANDANTLQLLNSCIIPDADGNMHFVQQIYIGPSKTQVWRVYKSQDASTSQLLWALYNVIFKTINTFNSTEYTQYAQKYVLRHQAIEVLTPTRPGYEFIEWKCVSDLDRGKPTSQRSKTNDIVSDCVFEAQYRINEYIEKISFDKTQVNTNNWNITVVRNGKSLTPTVIWHDDFCEITNLHYDDVVEITPSLRVGYDFAQWNDTYGVSVKSSITTLHRRIVIRSNDEMRIQTMTHKYTVSIRSVINGKTMSGGGKIQINGNGYSAINTQQISYLDEYTIDVLADTYYKFFRMEDVEGHVISLRGQVKSDMTLYAIFVDNDITLTYDNNDGITPIAYVSAICRKQVTIAKPTPREGYTFQGWLCNGVIYQANAIETFDDNVTLVAQWTANKYNVTLNFQNCGPQQSVRINNNGVISTQHISEGSGNQKFTYTVAHKSDFTVQILDQTTDIYAVFNDANEKFVYGTNATTATGFTPINVPEYNFSNITKNQTIYIGIIVKSREIIQEKTKTHGEIADIQLPFGLLVSGLNYSIAFTEIKIKHVGDKKSHVMHAYFGYSVNTDYIVTERTVTGLSCEWSNKLPDVNYQLNASASKISNLITIIAQCRDNAANGCAGIALRATCNVSILTT